MTDPSPLRPYKTQPPPPPTTHHLTTISHSRSHENTTTTTHGRHHHRPLPLTRSTSTPFAGRLGGNQEFVLDRSDPRNEELLKQIPDAAPNLTLREAFALGGFGEVGIWKAGGIEFVGSLIFVYSSAWNSLSPKVPPPPPSETLGPFNRVYFIGPLVSNVINAIILALLIFSFGAVSGAHFNPLITLGTFFARLTTFPRLVIYLGAQMSGGALAGLLLRASWNSRDFKAGGCYLFEEQGVVVSSVFTIEVVSEILLLFLAFGVGLDPRQAEIFGPALAPIFVGLAVGSIALLTAYSLPGYGGAGLNAARCFGVFVGSRFPGWHWVHWVAPFVASIFHGIVYFLVPPWDAAAIGAHRIGRPVEKVESGVETDGRESV